MNLRENTLAILNYENFDKMPVVHFGYWWETLLKWVEEGKLTREEVDYTYGNNEKAMALAHKLGFDYGWETAVGNNTGLIPGFERKIIEELPDGSRKVVDENGVIVLEKPGLVSIPQEFDHLLKDRESWEEHYLPRLKFTKDRINADYFNAVKAESEKTDIPVIMHVGSMFGEIRNWLGVEGTAYLWADDEDLYDEIIDTVGQLLLDCLNEALTYGIKVDVGHFWEDICFKNGPLVSPSVFDEKVGPWYKKINDRLREAGIKFTSLDCDGCIDALIPTWLENGVNIMFPIEYGTWEANIAPWREQYGRDIRGVGGMNKTVFAQDYAAIDKEIERLKKLIDLGGYIPCPDHRIAPDAIFENVQYYCDKMQNLKL